MGRKGNTLNSKNPIKKRGGKVESMYYDILSAVQTINDTWYNFLYYLGLTEPGDLDNILEALGNKRGGVFGFFYRRVLEKIERGEIKKEWIVKKKWIVDENTPPEEREAALKKESTEIHRALLLRYKNEVKGYQEKYKTFLERIPEYYYKRVVFSRKTLYLAPDGIKVDPQKFVEFYDSYMAASESELARLHKEAAEAMNRFFGGAVPITEEELHRYFVFNYGLEVNPESMNLESYSRLGIRTTKPNKK